MASEPKSRPTQERLKELFHYDLETGVFTRRQQPRTWSDNLDRKHGKVGAGRISTLGYAMISVDATNYNAGILAWLYVKGEWPRGRVKYLNGTKTDNRISNLFVQDETGGEIKDRSLTQERLKELLRYEPETGWFTWRLASSIANIGDRAGGHHGHGYRQIGLDYKKYLEHSLAVFYMTGEWPKDEVDHINGKKDDNRWVNLRLATRSENGHNKPVHRANRSGYPGVYLHGVSYRARIHVRKETIDLGCHATLPEARIARLLAEIEHCGRCTTFDENHDGALPFGGGRFIRAVLHSTEVHGKRVDCISLTNQHGVPFWVKSVETVSMIIDAWAPEKADRSGFQLVKTETVTPDGPSVEVNGPLGFGA
jgi:hypothetical protein